MADDSPSSAKDIPPVPTKTCSVCDQDLPLAHFPRRLKGQEIRLARCKQCATRYQTAWRHAKRRKELDLFARQVRDQRELNGLIQLTSRMLKRFGGAIGFAKVWYEHFQQAPPGSRHATNMLVAMSYMEIAAQTLKPRVDLSTLSDAELEELAKQQLADLLTSAGGGEFVVAGGQQ